MKLENIERVFVLGAGVSKHLGYPLTNDLIGEIIPNHFANDHDTFLIVNFIRNLYPNFDLNYKIYPNIEDVLSLIEVSKDIGAKIPSTEYRYYTDDVLEIKRAMLKKIYEYFFIKLKKVEGDKATKIVEFANCLKPSDVIISFNWDLNLEKALKKLKKEYQYNLADGKNIEKITILKPHGSMNWFKRDEISLSKDKTEPLFEGPKEIQVFKRLRPVNAIKKDFLPLIIAPIMQKEINEDLKKIWEDIYAVLSQTDKINILGYSLPNIDMNVRYIFRTAIRRNKHIQNYNRDKGQFLVVNPDDSVYMTYRNLVGEPIQFEQAKFEELNFEKLFNS